MPLVKLSQLDLFRLVIPVPESYVRYVRIGSPVSVRVPSFDRTFPGKVTRFSNDVHDATRTMHTEVDVPNQSGQLIPGLYAEATLVLNKSGDALTVPLQAVNRESEHTNVVVVNEQNEIEIRPVVLGVETENQAEVLSGLKEGDLVVVSDRAGLNPGEHVQTQIAPPVSYGSKA
jgi:RND family efflux transporter MFP subunit